ncbi:hypothetical protein [Rufibacter sp. LB8]|uniref:hypothetical protein n=1 Tax=Rufibacter sp. LB8 TaxID=2777781 RepID=UPI00178C4C03|nr:hypothetical protein [Rufibacter sp. LB8]
MPHQSPPTKALRLEIESNSAEQEFRVVALPDSSLLVITTKKGPFFGKTDFVLTRYNRQLEVIWQEKYPHTPGHTLKQVHAEGQAIYLVFTPPDHDRLFLYQVLKSTGKGGMQEYKIPNSDLIFKEMAVVQGQVFFHAIDGNNLVLLHLNPVAQTLSSVPSFFGLEDELGEFRADTASRSLEFALVESNGTLSRMHVKRLHANGVSKGNYFIQPDFKLRNNYLLQTARLTPGDTLTKLLIGTYGYRTQQFAKGLFVSPLAGQITYLDFGDLPHFFGYLSPRAERRMKAKYAQKEAQGQPVVLKQKLLLHPIQPHPLGYAVVAEVYYPHYTTITKDQFRKENGRLPDYNDLRFRLDGYHFTHALACVFDFEGNLLWDNTYKMRKKTYPTLAPTLQAGVSAAGNITLLQQEREFVWYKTLMPNTAFSNDQRMRVATQDNTEKVVFSKFENIIHWYGGNFIASGFQRIKSAKGDARTVFYLQNLQFK